MLDFIQPVLAGLVVAIINKYIINNNSLWNICSTTTVISTHEDDDVASRTTTISDASTFNETHIHISHTS